jgi:hypothetical protein
MITLLLFHCSFIDLSTYVKVKENIMTAVEHGFDLNRGYTQNLWISMYRQHIRLHFLTY